MMYLWPSCTNERRDDAHFAGGQANRHPVRHLRL